MWNYFYSFYFGVSYMKFIKKKLKENSLSIRIIVLLLHMENGEQMKSIEKMSKKHMHSTDIWKRILPLVLLQPSWDNGIFDAINV